MSSLTNSTTERRDGQDLPTGDSDVAACFPKAVNDSEVLGIVRNFQDWLVKVAGSGIKDFFNSLAATLKEISGAQLITVWDHNKHGRCLVLQASLPERDSVLASHTIPIENSSTGLVIDRRDFVYYPNILSPGGGRRFINSAIVEDLNLTAMISVPVFTPTKPREVSLVVNFCYDSEHEARFPLLRVDADRLLYRLGMSLQYQVYRRDKEINDKVRVYAASAKGIHSLFDDMEGLLRELTRSTHTSLSTWNEAAKELVLERTTARAGEESLAHGHDHGSQLVRTCVVEGRPLAARVGSADETITVQCPLMAAPIYSSANKVIAVLSCAEPLTGKRTSPSFSSLDLLTLEAFAAAAAPSIERFLRFRQESGMMRAIRRVSQSMAQADGLKNVLQQTIETLLEVFNSEVGSIYLREEDTEVFKIRAAKGSNEKLIAIGASYQAGKGITGTIATGQILNFRSLAEMRSHPSYLGRYDAEIWGPDADHDRETFLGVPITIGDKVIGLWKISNVSATPDHPDPYYTDEDVQLAQIISSLIAYAIENYRHEEMVLRQFKQFAITCIRIQRAPDTESAIRVVMEALVEARFKGALLSLYDPRTRELSPASTSGDTWKKTSKGRCQIGEDDIRAVVLRTGQDEFVKYSNQDLRCRNNPLDMPLLAQYVLPLRLGDELIGTLQVDMGDETQLGHYKQLILKAFAGHLAIALSRRRSIQQTLDLTNQVLASSRFITAEALSGMAVHSFHHKLAHIIRELQHELGRREVRESRLLNETFRDWKAKLSDLEGDLKNALLFVRAPLDETYAGDVDLHPEIQKAISTWINYLHHNKCGVRTVLKAENSLCRIPAEAFREIMSVLLVNAVQAHARHVEIKTSNGSNVRAASGKVIRSAFCLECSDDGIGIATQEYEKLFEANYTTKPQTFGTGLGLFIARRLARDGGGDLEVVQKSHQSKGATFRLTLPVTEGPK
jgi:signal transduction histidine kinase